MIYLIALLHAVPVLVIGLASNSKSRAIYTAIFMATIGVLTGNPVYMAIDLFAVGLALWFCLAVINEPSQSQAPKPNSPGWVSLGEAKKPAEVGQDAMTDSDLVSNTSTSFASNTERLAALRVKYKVKPLAIKINVVRATGIEPTEVNQGGMTNSERLAAQPIQYASNTERLAALREQAGQQRKSIKVSVKRNTGPEI